MVSPYLEYQPGFIFIIIKQNVHFPHIFHNSSLGRDLAILARCNHTILSYGTYSFWAGYLSGGLRIIPKMILHRKRNPLDITLKRFTMPDEDITANQIQLKNSNA